MITLEIEHAIKNYEDWKNAFDSDPIDRKKAGVKHYRIYRPVDNPNHVIIQLDFKTLEEAKATLEALKKMWTKVEGTIMFNPQTRILGIAESAEL
jgi:hypothetical protein